MYAIDQALSCHPLTPFDFKCFYDNIVFAPFIFIEDPFDAPKERSLTIDGGLTTRVSAHSVSSVSNSGTTLLGKAPRIDPYYLITRVRIALLIPTTTSQLH
jgi:hypothetical protein